MPLFIGKDKISPKLAEATTGIGTDTTDADAVANDMRKDKTAYVNGKKVVGNVNDLAAATYTPTTEDQVILANQMLSGNQTIKGDPNLISENIAEGIAIFGIEGSHSAPKSVIIVNGSTDGPKSNVTFDKTFAEVSTSVKSGMVPILKIARTDVPVSMYFTGMMYADGQGILFTAIDSSNILYTVMMTSNSTSSPINTKNLIDESNFNTNVDYYFNDGSFDNKYIYIDSNGVITGVDIPVANNTTLGMVKPIAKTTAMTQDVGIDENGRLYTAKGTNVTVSDAINSTSTTEAASSNAVKKAYDLANEAKTAATNSQTKVNTVESSLNTLKGNTEDWTFTLTDGSTVTKKVILG